MLRYYCARPEDLGRIGREGLSLEGAEGPALGRSLAAVRGSCDGCILVVDASRIPGGVGDGRVRGYVPPKAILNLFPYLPPRAVIAAGGCIVRRGSEGPDVLLIFRRGVWDLPKGKLDAGEAVEACALREVREEVGASRLSVLAALGTTEHGYPEGGAYRVKTTHWFLMETPETVFTPEEREGIEQVAWVPWREAVERVGFDTLRRHLAAQEGAARAALGYM